MTKTFTATLLAAAIAVSGVAATPARAGSDTEKAALFILGAAALVAIANDAKRKSKKAHQVNQAPPPPTVTYGYPTSQQGHGNHSDHHKNHAHAGKKGRPVELPVSCLRPVNGPSGGQRDRRYVMSEHCLAKSGFWLALPQSCAVPVPSRHGPQRGYSANCLIGKGYVVGDLRP